MHYVIYGAGGIGGVIGGRLHQAGLRATLIARGEHGRALARHGLRLVSPTGVDQIDVPAVEHPAQISFAEDTVVLLCMKSQHTQSALEDLARGAGLQTAVVCVQNGVANERLALRFFPNVYGSVVNLPAMFLEPGEVVTFAQGFGGILDTGCYPGGLDARAEQINADLSLAGFSAHPAEAVMRQKYAKLLLNLFNVLQAGLSDPEAAGALARALRKEALACYAAASVDCASRDEIRARQEGVYRAVEVPGYERPGGSSWQSVKRGTGDIETDYLNGEICLLGRLHGVATPLNDACVALGRELVRSGQGPGIISTAEFCRRAGVVVS